MFRTALACCTALALTAGAAAAQTMSCGIGIGKPCPVDPQGVLLERLARDHPLPKPVVRKTVMQAEFRRPDRPALATLSATGHERRRG